jgi:septum formation protein
LPFSLLGQPLQPLDISRFPNKLGRVKLPPFILASASPRRAELLRQLKLEFEVFPSDAKEVCDENLSPLELCQLNAHRKARAVAKKIPDALVLGADTLVFLDRQIFGKPADLAEAKKMLLELQGRTHQVVTGVSLIRLRTYRERIFAVSTDVVFRPLTPAQIDEYLYGINPLDKAGAYAIQEHGELIVAEISGSFSNVVGLPIEKVQEELAAWPE